MKFGSILKKVTALTLCLSMTLMSACSTAASPSGDLSGDVGNDVKAMGRYIESDVELPEGLSLARVMKIYEDKVRVNLYDDNNVNYFYDYDGSSWSKINDIDYFGLASSAVEGNSYPSEYTFDSQDNFYMIVTQILEDGMGNPVLVKVDKSGKAEIVDMKWQKRGDKNIFVHEIAVDSQGNILAVQSSQGIYRYSPDGTYMDCYSSDMIGSMTLMGDDIAIVDNVTGAMVVYNMDSQTVSTSIPLESAGFGGIPVAGEDKAAYYVSSTGIYKCLPGGSVLEKIADGDINSLSIPSLSIAGAVYLSGQVYVNFSDMNTYKNKLTMFAYSADTPSRPDEEITVYSLHDNDTIRQAAGEFQRANPNVKVNVQSPMGNKNNSGMMVTNYGVGYKEDDSSDSSATSEDVIRALNTELLNKKGPDVLILDGLPMSSYMEKGVLMDISDILNPLISSGELLENIVSAYAEGDNVFAVPVRFNVPAIFTDKSLNGFGSLKDMAEFARAHKDLPVLKKYTQQNLMELFYYSSAPAFTEADGKINRDEFIKYISYLKDIYDTSWPDDMGRGETVSLRSKSSMSEMDWSTGKSYAATSVLRGIRASSMRIATLQKQGNGMMVQLPGLKGNAFEPLCIAAINANTSKAELAKAFVNTLLSESVQSSDLGDGFAVNEKIYEAAAAIGEPDQTMMWYTSSSDSDNNEVEMSGNDPSGEDLKPIIDMCHNVNTPVIMDKTLLEIMVKNTEGFFNGSMTAEDAADAVIEGARLYLGE